jgi:hypothetical protein
MQNNGTAQVKRAYGDWSNCSLKGWKDELLQPCPNVSTFIPLKTSEAHQHQSYIYSPVIEFEGDILYAVSPHISLSKRRSQANVLTPRPVNSKRGLFLYSGHFLGSHAPVGALSEYLH